ncbi:MAG: hypothetical protein K8T10_15820 [Candidatus Eremiobacteraeota bacterium]|nr:hypothetical protein [Candidatus Eremiobacteraeota bacterium]
MEPTSDGVDVQHKIIEKMKGLNPNALIGIEDGILCFIEDFTDSDGRIYRIEIKASPNGEQARAYCIYNPWGENPYSYQTSHLRYDGLIDLGMDQPDFSSALYRARYWCQCFSILMESGKFPNPP